MLFEVTQVCFIKNVGFSLIPGNTIQLLRSTQWFRSSWKRKRWNNFSTRLSPYDFSLLSLIKDNSVWTSIWLSKYVKVLPFIPVSTWSACTEWISKQCAPNIQCLNIIIKYLIHKGRLGYKLCLLLRTTLDIKWFTDHNQISE